jgi:hypothetical protein
LPLSPASAFFPHAFNLGKRDKFLACDQLRYEPPGIAFLAQALGAHRTVRKRDPSGDFQPQRRFGRVLAGDIHLALLIALPLVIIT